MTDEPQNSAGSKPSIFQHLLVLKVRALRVATGHLILETRMKVTDIVESVRLAGINTS